VASFSLLGFFVLPFGASLLALNREKRQIWARLKERKKTKTKTYLGYYFLLDFLTFAQRIDGSLMHCFLIVKRLNSEKKNSKKKNPKNKKLVYFSNRSRMGRDRARDKKRSRSRSRSPRRDRDGGRREKKHSEKSSSSAAKVEKAKADLEEERKKRERQEAWKKAKEEMMKEEAKNSVQFVGSLGGGGLGAAPAVPPVAAAPSVKSDANALFFGDDEEEEKKASDPTQMFAEFKDVVPDEEQDEGEKEEDVANPDDNEPDELEMFMTGIVAEHEKLLKQDKSKGGGQKGDVGGDDDDEVDPRMMDRSDDELFLAGPTSKKKTLEAVNHSEVAYRKFNKNFYIETENIRKMTDAEVKKLRKEMDHIVVRGKNCPKPVTKFTEAGLSDGVLKIMEKAGFIKPTPIQAQALPAIMSGRDVIGIAKTGSGKTLAYLLPMIRHIADQPPIQERDGPVGLILVPTRELCMQIAQELKRFKPSGLNAVAVYGGSDVSYQIGALKRGCEVVVATPGRFIDILSLNSGKITNLARVTYLVLDEADRMFDMGFAPQISKIIDNVRPSRQAVMFSATFPTSVETLARKALKNPVEIVVGGRLQVCGDVDQKIEVVKEELKFPKLLQALGKWSDRGQILIFTDRQESVDQLYRQLLEQGYNSMTLHGGKDQLDRISVISDFKSGLENIMIATSVAARGLDVKNLILVVNYTCPNHVEDYVHRVGRTGRAGRKGTSITFLTADDARFAPELAKIMLESGKPVPEKLKELASSYQTQVSSGVITDHKNDGYKTKGFKFTDEEKKAQRKMEMATYGIFLPDSDDDEDDKKNGEDEDDDDDEDEGDDDEGDEKKMLNKLEKDMSVTKKVLAKLSHQSTLEEQERLKQAAVIGGGLKRAAEIARALANKDRDPNAQRILNGEDQEQQLVSSEIELNDFSQQIRFRMSNRETIDQIQEMYPGVAITIRGSYVVPGRKPPPGIKKLHAYISGRSEMEVVGARKEMIRQMKELAASGNASANSRYSKYQVV
jgi:ATP-dependent RNA helicase DDX46/PRP5